MNALDRVGVVGCGLMGSGIAEVCARAGLDVVVAERDGGAARAGRLRITASLDRGVRSGKLAAEDRDDVLSRLRFTDDLAALADRGLVVEAVAEHRDVKAATLAAVDRHLALDDAVIASNTSSIPIIDLAAATERPESVIGLHFFNPVPVQRLVEVVPTQLTADTVTEQVSAFAAERLGKTVVRARDRSGFVVNALLVPYLLSAVRMLESGFASAEDIDHGMVLGCACSTSSASTPRTRSPTPCTRSSRNRCTPRPPCSAAWSPPAPWAVSQGGASTRTEHPGGAYRPSGLRDRRV